MPNSDGAPRLGRGGGEQGGLVWACSFQCVAGCPKGKFAHSDFDVSANAFHSVVLAVARGAAKKLSGSGCTSV